ncbi:hypothetical protein CALVIDRAFT_595304 [Calocera viscosa TUFC12733]|uniref:Autophagy-related protein 17 n=1 Tax=Calocera viscosa (strain TUFC12733) TaxID=1330018 RepID=A0A167R2V3_CALVF|nr:hypothetical protein CALVIDRAFT_595304 [Calocera viscosa TUFC12733]
MSSPPTSTLIPSLLQTSKSALQTGQALCTRAHARSLQSASWAVEALAKDARARWGREACERMLREAEGIVVALGGRRGRVLEEIRRWDIMRDEATEALDSQLDRLSQVGVPRGMWAARSGEEEGVDPFDEDGSQGDAEDAGGEDGLLVRSGLRDGSGERKGTDKGREAGERSRRNLRDFVDEREVDELMDRMEQDRTVLDEALRSPDVPTPHALTSAIAHLRGSLPPPRPSHTHTIHALLAQQEELTSTMSIALESLTLHYEQMQHAASDVRAGIALEREDVDVLVRDTQEVGPILEELELATGQVEQVGERLREAGKVQGGQVLDAACEGLENLRKGMQDLAGHIAHIEETTTAVLPMLNAHLAGVNSLQAHFGEVERAYEQLVLELARRGAAKARAERLIEELEMQLEGWYAEESREREAFLEETGEWLPPGLCPAVGDAPERWVVRALEGGGGGGLARHALEGT